MNVTPKKVRNLWIGLFLVWSVLLSGALSSVTGGPGVIQAFKLRNLIQIKRQDLDREERSKEKLTLERKALVSSPEMQAKEIRRVLGFAAKDELIFDFSRNTYLFHDP